jgi:hypothetical protein
MTHTSSAFLLKSAMKDLFPLAMFTEIFSGVIENDLTAKMSGKALQPDYLIIHFGVGGVLGLYS